MHVTLSGLEGCLLNTEMGCAPLLYLRCSELYVDSRYTCDQMHAVRLHSHSRTLGCAPLCCTRASLWVVCPLPPHS